MLLYRWMCRWRTRKLNTFPRDQSLQRCYLSHHLQSILLHHLLRRRLTRRRLVRRTPIRHPLRCTYPSLKTTRQEEDRLKGVGSHPKCHRYALIIGDPRPPVARIRRSLKRMEEVSLGVVTRTTTMSPPNWEKEPLARSTRRSRKRRRGWLP